MKNSRKIIRVQPIYTMLIWFILVLVFTTFLVFPSFIWENKHDVWEIVYYLMFSICLAACLFAFLYYIQFAILDEEGITIRGLFHTIAKVKWNGIYSIEERSVVTYDNRGYISLRWLVIHLQKKEPEIKRGGINKRNKPPWQIVATKKN